MFSLLFSLHLFLKRTNTHTNTHCKNQRSNNMCRPCSYSIKLCRDLLAVHTKAASDWCSGRAATWVHHVISLHQRAPQCDVSLTSLISMRGRPPHQGSGHTPQLQHKPSKCTGNANDTRLHHQPQGQAKKEVPVRIGCTKPHAIVRERTHTHTHTHTHTPQHQVAAQLFQAYALASARRRLLAKG